MRIPTRSDVAKVPLSIIASLFPAKKIGVRVPDGHSIDARTMTFAVSTITPETAGLNDGKTRDICLTAYAGETNEHFAMP